MLGLKKCKDIKFSGAIDSDGDGLTDEEDTDDDNDGLLDTGNHLVTFVSDLI